MSAVSSTPTPNGRRGPTQRVDEQSQIARVTNDTIDIAGDQRVSGLDSHQPAEPMTEHKDWPDSQRATGREENDAKPANGIAVEGPELLPVRVGWQIGVQQSDQRKSDDDPAVATILAYPELKFPSAKSARPASAKTANARAISAGWEKKAVSPSQPRTARPR